MSAGLEPSFLDPQSQDKFACSIEDGIDFFLSGITIAYIKHELSKRTFFQRFFSRFADENGVLQQLDSIF